MQRTMTEGQAGERAEERVRDAMKVLPEDARLELRYLPSTPCDDPSDNGPRGRVEVNRQYWIRGIGDDRIDQQFDSLLNYWRHHDFKILNDFRPRDYFISVENNEDAFRMSIRRGASGALSIGASSPCVWPDGTPPPGDSGN